MLFNTYKHTDLLGALVRYSVPTDCTVALSTLITRMQNAGVGAFAPSRRHRADAMRLAISEVAKRSKVTHSDGTTESIVIASMERKDGATYQAWAVHRQVKDRNNQDVSYKFVDNILLYDDGYIQCPSVLGGDAGILEIVDKYENLADHTKIRESIRKVVQYLGEPIPLNGLFFVAQHRIESLRETLSGIFEGLDTGKASVSIYEIASTPGNAQSLAQEMNDSIASALGNIELGIAKAKEENASLTKGIVAEWLATIATLKANMTEMGVVNVTLPSNLSELEAKLQDLRAEVSKPKSKRVLAAL